MWGFWLNWGGVGGHTHAGQSTRITPGCNSAERARQVRSPPEVQDLGTGPTLGSGDLGAGPALGSGCQASLHPSFCSVVAVLRGNLHQSLVFIKLCVKHSLRRDGSPRLPGSLRLKAGRWKGAAGGRGRMGWVPGLTALQSGNGLLCNQQPFIPLDRPGCERGDGPGVGQGGQDHRPQRGCGEAGDRARAALQTPSRQEGDSGRGKLRGGTGREPARGQEASAP